MIRIAGNSLENFLVKGKNDDDILSDIKYIDEIVKQTNVTVISLGPIYSPQYIYLIPKIINSSNLVFVSYLTLQKSFKLNAAKDLAKSFLDIADLNGGNGSLRTTVSSNFVPGCPYFPGSYHYPAINVSDSERKVQNSQDVDMFAIGLENSESLANAVQDSAGDLEKFQKLYGDKQEQIALFIQDIAETLCKDVKSQVHYNGIDLSIAPGLATKNLMDCYKCFGTQHLNEPGALTITSAITQTVKAPTYQDKIKTCGYNGVMIAICEDPGLVKETEHGLAVNDLLLLSSVCGVGLDCIPVVGNPEPGQYDENHVEQMAKCILDMHTMAYRLDKPLSCRFLPQPKAYIGEMSNYKCPHLVDGRIMPIVRK